MRKYFLIGALLFVLGIIIISCSGTPYTGKKPVPGSKMTAKEKQAKNGIIDKNHNWSHNDLLGKVRTFDITTYDISNAGEKQFYSRQVEVFDANGNMVESICYDRNGKAEKKNIWVYDANGNDTLSVAYDALTNTSVKKVMKYDSNGNEVEEYECDSDGKMTGKCTYGYDGKNNIVASAYDNAYGKGSSKYTYDANGFKASNTSYDSSGKQGTKHVYKRDEYGNELEWMFYNEDGTMDSKYVSKYDENGNCTEMVLLKPASGLSVKVTAKYDSKGNQVCKEVYFADGKIDERASSTIDLEYDQTGNIIKETKFKKKNGKRTIFGVKETKIVYY